MKQTLKYIYDHLVDSQKFAESKHSITIALAGAIIAFASAFLNMSTPLISTLSAGCIIFALISVLYSFIALSAKKVSVKEEIKLKKADKVKNMLYYKHIKNYDVEGYLRTLKEYYEFPKNYKIDAFDRDLAKQIISTARVSYLKFLYFNISLIFLFLSLICCVVAIILLGRI